MELIVIVVVATVVGLAFSLLFMLLFLVRRLGNRWLWSRALKFVRPVLRELYAADLAAAANSVLQAQPVEIHLSKQRQHVWKDAAAAEALTEGLRKRGFSDAGVHAIDKFPGVFVRLMVNEWSSSGAAVYEHPQAGVWADVVGVYDGGGTFCCSSGKDPGLPARLRPPDTKIEYFPGADAGTLYARWQAGRAAQGLVKLTAGDIAAKFEEAWAREMDWRTQEELLPEEARAFKDGKPMPQAEARRAGIFDMAAFVMAALNLVLMMTVLFAARDYWPVGNGPWREALWHTLAPLLFFVWLFMNSVRTQGPIARSVAWVIMLVVAYPFFFGTVYFGEIWVNGAGDTGQPAVHSAAVLGAKATGRRERDHYVTLKAWSPGRATERLRVTREQYLRLRPGGSVARVTTRPGLLGHEWLAGLEFDY